MNDVKWIKISTNIFDDEKIQLIESMPKADSILIVWFKLLCLAGKTNNSGVFLLNDVIPYTNEMLSKIFRRKKSTVENALKIFQEFGMIEIVDDVITIPKWGEHQSLESIERKKEYMKTYMQEYREKQKSKVRKTNGKANCKTNVSRTEIEKEKEIKNNIFTPPTVEEVKAYCQERNNNVDPVTFVNFYSSKGWMVGKNKMKDWKACVRTWERSEDRTTKPTVNTKIHNYNERDYDFDELMKGIVQ